MGFDLGVYMAPYWLGRQVCYEAVMVVEQADGSVPDIPLLYEATQILEVCSSDHGTGIQRGRTMLWWRVSCGFCPAPGSPGWTTIPIIPRPRWN